MLAPKAPIVLVDDGRGRFGPLGDLRATFEFRTGADTTVRRVARLVGDRLTALWVPVHLVAALRERSLIPVNELPAAQRLVLLNGRWLTPDLHAIDSLGPDEIIVDAASGDLVMAHLAPESARLLLERAGDDSRPIESIADLAGVRTRPVEGLLISRPWEILAALGKTIALDVATDRPLRSREAEPAVAIGDAPISIHASARVWPGVVIDAEHGPVAIHEDAIIRPHATLVGPCAIGRGSTVVERAVIRGNTVIGPRCKVGGEISGTIFQGYSNKAHDGFLGDSIIGEWVNIGAGTDNSNLLNTYGEVSVRLSADGPRERTGRQFMGAVMGDHVKIAIGSRIMTGTVLGTGSMVAVATPPPALVPAFAWLTDEDSSGARRFRFEKFEETMRAVMKRRDREPGPAYLAALRALHAGSAPAAR